jgi:hypothetical protein
MYIHTHIHTHTCTYTHIYTHKHRWRRLEEEGRMIGGGGKDDWRRREG